MPTYTIQVATAADSVLARDAIVNTFHVDDKGAFSDPDGLAEDTVGIWQQLYGAARQIEARVYDTGTAPNFPLGQFIANAGQAPASTFPREVALCLSYYGERNLPRTRGRMYVCAAIASNLVPNKVRPSLGDMNALLDHADRISGLGGADVDWITFSSVDGSNEPVQTAWVDDEWDTMRSRGLRATTRTIRSQSG
jgi:hypothetical protein